MIRRFINLSLWASGFGLFLLGYAAGVEPALLYEREVEFISEKYDGPELRIGVITDIHIGSAPVPAKRVKSIVSKINQLEPDVIIIPGDFVGTHLSYAEETDEFNTNVKIGLSYLKHLEAPVFTTLGNHDALYDRGRMSDWLVKADMTLLENAAAPFGELCLVGLGDYKTLGADRAAYESCPSNLPPFIFTHSPDVWRDFRSDAILALAGHTHGGQVNLPIIGRRVNSTSLGPEHSYGFSKLGGVDVFVSAGVGTSILPIRFRAPPEIVVITLRAQP